MFHSGGGAHHDILGVLIHGEGDDLADRAFTGQQHHHAVHAGGDAGVGRCTVAEGVVHGGELLLHILLAQAHQLKGLDHDLGVVVTDGTAGQLHAVAHQVILVGGDGQGVDFAPLRLQQYLQAAAGHGERIVAELQLAGLVADLVHGEVHDPAELVALLVHVALTGRAEGLDEHTGGFGGGGTCGPQPQSVGLQIQGLGQLLLKACDELGNAAGQLAVFVRLEPVGFGAGLHLAVGQQLVDLLAGELAVGHGDHLHGLTPQGVELTLGKQGGDILAGQVNAQVGLIGAVGLHGVPIGNAAEGGGGGHVIGAELGEDGRQHVLQHGEHILLGGEGHFHIQLVELAGGTVASGVLVPEAGGNLEIAVKPGGHQQLLELLGSLGQSIELAGVLPGGHQIIPGALRGGGRQDGRGDFQETVIRHGGPQGGHHLAAEDDVALYCRVPQVQITIFQTLGLVGLAAAVDLKGQAVVAAAAQDLNFFGEHLHIAGGLLGILAGPLPDGALYADGGLLVQAVDDVHHFLTLYHHLGSAVEVTQHHKGEVLAHHADVLHPTHDLHVLSGVGQTQLPAGMGSHLHHIDLSCSDYNLYFS